MCSQICMLVESPVGECNSRPAYEISELRISMDFMDVFILFWQDKDKSRGYFCKTSCEAGWCSQHLQPACKTSPWPPTPRSMRKFSKAEVRGRKAVPRPSWQKESAQTTSLMKRYSDATCGQIFEDKTQNLSKWLIWNCHLSVEYMILTCVQEIHLHSGHFVHITGFFLWSQPARSFFACHPGIADWFVERVILCKEWSSRAWYAGYLFC